MYAPGRPIRSALPRNVATMAIRTIVGTTNSGISAAEAPSVTVTAKDAAIAARLQGAVQIGAIAPVKRGKGADGAISPAVMSPAAQAANTGGACREWPAAAGWAQFEQRGEPKGRRRRNRRG